MFEASVDWKGRCDGTHPGMEKEWKIEKTHRRWSSLFSSTFLKMTADWGLNRDLEVWKMSEDKELSFSGSMNRASMDTLVLRPKGPQIDRSMVNI